MQGVRSRSVRTRSNCSAVRSVERRASSRSVRTRGNCYAVSRDARKCLVLRTQQCCKDCPRPTDVDELFWGLCLLGRGQRMTSSCLRPVYTLLLLQLTIKVVVRVDVAAHFPGRLLVPAPASALLAAMAWADLAGRVGKAGRVDPAGTVARAGLAGRV